MHFSVVFCPSTMSSVLSSDGSRILAASVTRSLKMCAATLSELQKKICTCNVFKYLYRLHYEL